MPNISIVVPVYKVEKYINQCIQSLLAQTYVDFELILVDDGSPDNCPYICDEWAEKDNRIHVIHKQNGGLSSARNAGVALAQSPFIAFVDSDDWVEPTFLEVLYTAIVQENADIVQINYQHVSEKGVVLYKSPAAVMNAQDIRYNLLQKMACNEKIAISASRWTKIYKSAIVKYAVSLCPPDQVNGEDYLMNMAALTKCEKIVVLDSAPLYNYRHNESSITTNYNPKTAYQEKQFWTSICHIASLVGIDKTIDLQQTLNDAQLTHIYQCAFSNLKYTEKMKEIQQLKKQLPSSKTLLMETYDKSAVKKLFLLSVFFHFTPISVLVVHGMQHFKNLWRR